MDNEIQKLAEELYQEKSVLIMGRGYHYATCLEGALVSQIGSTQIYNAGYLIKVRLHEIVNLFSHRINIMV